MSEQLRYALTSSWGDMPHRVVLDACARCGALVPVEDDLVEQHTDWHAAMDTLARRVAEVTL